MPSPRVLAFDAGGTKLLGGVVSEDGSVAQRVWRVIAGLARDELLETIFDAVEEARGWAPDAVAVGFGIPSLIDRRSGVSELSVHLPLDGVPFGRVVSDRVGLPVAWDNDTNVALVAEHRLGAARGTRHAVMLTIGTGIGGAMVLDGRLYRGSAGAAGELGHAVVDLDGPPCQGDCPGRGCLEALASGTAIAREGAAAAAALPGSPLGRAAAEGGPVTGELVTELALGGDEVARAVLTLTGERLGAGLVSIAHAFDPEVIVVGGGAMAAGDLLLGPARSVLDRHALPPIRDRVRVVPARFGDGAGLVGAGLAALELAAGGEGAEAWR